jgi:hypothetical protein
MFSSRQKSPRSPNALIFATGLLSPCFDPNATLVDFFSQDTTGSIFHSVEIDSQLSNMLSVTGDNRLPKVARTMYKITRENMEPTITHNGKIPEFYRTVLFWKTVGGRILDSASRRLRNVRLSRGRKCWNERFDLFPHEIARTFPDVFSTHSERRLDGRRRRHSQGRLHFLKLSSRLNFREGDEDMVLVISPPAPIDAQPRGMGSHRGRLAIFSLV